MIGTRALVAIALIVVESARLARTIELQDSTVDAWHVYLRGAGIRLQARLNHEQAFLWIDEAPDRAARVRRGEIVVEPVVEHGTQDVPDGLIHDWIGGVFFPQCDPRDPRSSRRRVRHRHAATPGWREP